MKTGSDRAVSDKTCEVCGGNAGPILGQKHCQTEECSRGYLLHLIETSYEVQGSCKVWKRSIRKGGVAYVTLTRAWPEGKRKDFRVLDVLAEQRGENMQQVQNRNYRSLCGTNGCIVPEHHELVIGNPSLSIAARLPVTPLVEAVERRKVVLPKQLSETLRRAKHKGHLSVTRVDEICIDGLKCHPAEIYGEEFFTAC